MSPVSRHYQPLLFFPLLLGVECACPELGIHAVSSDTNSWPPGFRLSGGENITLYFPLILDQETPRLSGLHIVAGGRLVFSPHGALAKLVTDYVVIDDGGSLEIGSENCPFVGQAEILLTGKKGSYDSIDGEKFISVHSGGRLEIHGEPKKAWTKLNKTIIRGEGLRSIHLVDDVSSWKKGDQLVLASTDYDLNQAEVVTVEACEKYTCELEEGLVKFDHFGEVDSGVDMRGEVGLISRNILIQGEMEETCYGDQLCQHFVFDTFGGHIIAREGFASFKVEHAELTNLGQQGLVGRYPLHWHMAGNIKDGTSYVRSNSIHHTLQRCVTCHGSFGCIIQDNVAFESLGHCYFMEDGVERNTVMTGNLGVNTRKALMLLSDADPATFWITHPDSFITENTAAGSEGKGFWFLQASFPTGLSGELQEANKKHFFGRDEAFRTKIGSISGNTAHSSMFGIFFDSVLQPDQSAKGSGKFSPKEDPTDAKSPDLTTTVEDITCYKAGLTCVWMDLPGGHYSNIRVADSSEGMFVREETFIQNSLFVGESRKNYGFPNKRIGRNVWYRSLPRSNSRFGFRNYVNPTFVHNTVFDSFGDSETGTSRALGFRAVSFKSIMTGVSNITFLDTPFSSRFLENKEPPREFIYGDYTGSLTGIPSSFLVQNLSHLTSYSCEELPDWGSVSSCPHRYASILLGKMRNKVTLMRTDQPGSVYPPQQNENTVFISMNHTYILSFLGHFPFTRVIRGKQVSTVFVSGVDLGDTFILGMCVPLGSVLTVSQHTRVSSIEQIRNNTSGLVFFYDVDVGLVFISFKGTLERKPEDRDPCGKDRSACMTKVRIFVSVRRILSYLTL